MIRIKKQESLRDTPSRRLTVVGRLWESDKFTKERDHERYSSTEDELEEDDLFSCAMISDSEEPTLVIDTGMFSVKVSGGGGGVL